MKERENCLDIRLLKEGILGSISIKTNERKGKLLGHSTYQRGNPCFNYLTQKQN